MDDRRFDALTKAWARGTSRRTLLKGLLAGAAGSLTGAVAHDQASAVICRQGGVLCATNAQCCSGACVNDHCTCRQDQIPCGPRCCAAGQTCVSGQCVTPTTTSTDPATTTTTTSTTTTTAAPTTTTTAAPTTTSTTTAQPTTTSTTTSTTTPAPTTTTTTTAAPTTTTTTTPACLPPSMTCMTASQCCTGSCCSNSCVDVSGGDVANYGACGNFCGGASECAAPTCTNGICGTRPTNSGNACEGGAGTCQNGTCVPTTTTTTSTTTTTAAPCNLQPDQGPCNSNSDCCSNQCLSDPPAGAGLSICCPVCPSGCFCRVTSDAFGRAVCATSGGSATSCLKSSDCPPNEFCNLLNNCSALCPS